MRMMKSCSCYGQICSLGACLVVGLHRGEAIGVAVASEGRQERGAKGNEEDHEEGAHSPVWRFQQEGSFNAFRSPYGFCEWVPLT